MKRRSRCRVGLTHFARRVASAHLLRFTGTCRLKEVAPCIVTADGAHFQLRYFQNKYHSCETNEEEVPVPRGTNTFCPQGRLGSPAAFHWNMPVEGGRAVSASIYLAISCGSGLR
ncbi:hypothetical protein NDU88_004446 [Pleurodeles waltl]|uniref:Uncharacterized protein n=1 Tax=Pleurodeles waltl TaxID=8319 RepID=A0AAV7RGX9_PLEWA|nr:hypothetical protein NDU88_004446 [Pleurodeles waltl]